MEPKRTEQKKAFFYAVRNGRTPGIYKTWGECQANITGFPNAAFKKFPTVEEAQLFIDIKKEGNRITPKVITPKVITPKVTTPKVTKRKFEDDDSKVAKYTKHEQKPPTTVVYTDGASSNNGKSHARAGYGVYWGDNDSRNASIRLLGRKQTNQRAEASAVNHAIEQDLDGTNTLEIMTDSQYVINAATIWSKSWVKKGWKSSTGATVQNRDLFERMLNLIALRKGPVKFTYVPGHKGVKGNEKADSLAVAGAQLQ